MRDFPLICCRCGDSETARYEFTSSGQGIAICKRCQHPGRSYIRRRDKLICYMCGRLTDGRRTPRHALSTVVEHIDPLVLRGDQQRHANMAVACVSCNSRKGNRPLTREMLTPGVDTPGRRIAEEILQMAEWLA